MTEELLVVKFRCHKTHFLPKFERFTIQPCQNLASENKKITMAELKSALGIFP